MTPAFAALVATSMLGRAQGFVPDLPARPGPEEEVTTEPRAAAAVDPGLAAQVGAPGEVAFFAASAGTVRTPPPPPPDGAKASERPVIVLKRGTALAATALRRLADNGSGWDVEMVGRFRKATLRGAVLVTVYDASDRQALANREVTSLWSFLLPRTGFASVRVRLDEDGGYRAGREYLVRFVQLLGRREHVLAEGRVKLE